MTTYPAGYSTSLFKFRTLDIDLDVKIQSLGCV